MTSHGCVRLTAQIIFMAIVMRHRATKVRMIQNDFPYFGMVYPKHTDLELFVVRKSLYYKIVQKEKLKNFMAHAFVCP